MENLSRAVNAIRYPPTALLYLAVWFVLCLLAGSWLRGTLALGFLTVSTVTVWFLRWRKARLVLYADEGETEPPGDLRLFGRFLVEQWLKALVRSAWKSSVASTTGLTGGPLKLVPRLHDLRGTLDNVLVCRFSPGTVHADIDNYVTAAPKLRGMLRWPRILGPRLRDIIIVPTTPGDGRVEFHFGDRLSEVLPLQDLPKPTLPFHLSYGIRSNGAPAMLNYLQSVIIGGLTRRGKSVVGKVMLASLMALEVPVRLFIGDLKDGIELPELSTLGRLGRSSVEVADYQTTVSGAEKMLQRMHDEMVRRAEVMKAQGIKQWIPTAEHPLLIAWLDETLPLKGKLSVDKPIGKIGYVGAGRACVLWINSQLGEKSILGELRDLIPQRITFAVQTYQQTDMLLGDGAHLAGALPHKLGKKVGVGYSGSDGDETYVLFRAANCTVEQAGRLADGHVPAGMFEPKAAVKPGARHWLYRRFDDRPAFTEFYPTSLAYVGIHTGPDPRTRFRGHAARDWRWCKQHRRMENFWVEHGTRTEWVEVPGTRTDLRREERLAIETEFPAFNVQHNRGGRIGRKVKAAVRRPAKGRGAPAAVLVEEPHFDGAWSE